MARKLVIPGEFVAVSEEFMPGEGTYDRNGRIYSAYLGELELDTANKVARVKPLNPPVRLKVGDIVYGTVENIKETMVVVSVTAVEGKKRKISGDTEASIHISKISDRYTSDIRKKYRKGDIIRAMVIQTKPSLQLGTSRRSLGVVKALCTRCRFPMVRKGRDLFCEKCERTEVRKVAISYSNLLTGMQKNKNPKRYSG
ncbi:MAG: exosome complex RNA-binding protein Csl4 [Thermoplasmata archaeon]